MNLIWFKRDLRVLDNPALHQANMSGPCIAVYCLCEDQWDQHDTAQIQREFIVASLFSLASQLAKLNVPLIILDTKTFHGIPPAMVRFCQEHAIEQVFTNEDYELNEVSLLNETEQCLANHSIGLQRFHDQCLLPPGAVLNQQQAMYKVFSAFKRQYVQQLSDTYFAVLPGPKPQSPLAISSDVSVLSRMGYPVWTNARWPVGENAAHEQLTRFIEQDIAQYDQARDMASLDATSGLSAYLAIGVLSVKQCYLAAKFHHEQFNDEGSMVWISELIWRDFYRHIIFSQPQICKHVAYQVSTDTLPWQKNEPLFLSWCAGETGYPLVDAGMRQLNTIGWMHNRLRMVCAMFLTKHLFIDWRLGEKYFMRKLIDGDFASNNGGWQWSASTGVDAVPYFRIFNPTRQSQRFDAQGIFIRQYVPELASLNAKSIHQPNSIERQMCQYPLMIIDHSQAVADTKLKFKHLNTIAAGQPNGINP